MTLTIRVFGPKDQIKVKELILNGLVEHWKILDPTKNPDLNQIDVTYKQATFLVAEEDGQIIGCGALVTRTAETAEIVRMSVENKKRRTGLGTAILNHLEEIARQKNFKEIILETTSSWNEVIAFYLRNGYIITHYMGDDVYFRKIL